MIKKIVFFVLIILSTNAKANEVLQAKDPFVSSWSFSSKINKKYDKEQLKRGYKIYKDVCSSCHSMNYVHYKDLKKIGYEWAEIEEIASFYEYDGGFDDEGEPKVRKGQPIDIFKKPYPNEKYARFVNFGALPPDLTLMAKKRKGGVNYINSFLKGFEETPNQGEKISYDKTYNPYFPSRQTMMPPPLIEGMIEYEGKIKPTLKQMRKDVSAFLMWTANPNLEKRYSLGYKVLLYSFLLTLLLYLLQKAVWSDLKKEA